MQGIRPWLPGVLVVGLMGGGLLGLSAPAQAQTTSSTGVQSTLSTGVSAGALEDNTLLSVTRLTAMSNGGVMVTYSSPFCPDEVLSINEDNQPVLMTRDASGNLVPHPTRVAGVHQDDIIIMDKRVALEPLRDNLFPTVVFTDNTAEVRQIATNGDPVVCMLPTPSTPITSADFDRPLPAIVASTPSGSNERNVSLPLGSSVSLPPGWRTVTVGHSTLVLDNNGVIQNIVPY